MATAQRRSFLQATSAVALAGGFSPSAFATRLRGDPWIQAQEIIDRLSRPLTFRKQDFEVTGFGARPCPLVKVKAFVSHDDQDLVDTQAPGSFDCREAFARAMAACSDAGGGRVVIPSGNWF